MRADEETSRQPGPEAWPGPMRAGDGCGGTARRSTSLTMLLSPPCLYFDMCVRACVGREQGQVDGKYLCMYVLGHDMYMPTDRMYRIPRGTLDRGWQGGAQKRRQPSCSLGRMGISVHVFVDKGKTGEKVRNQLTISVPAAMNGPGKQRAQLGFRSSHLVRGQMTCWPLQ